MKNTMDMQEILKKLPHRYPFLLVDKILDYRSGESIVGLKNVTINEPFFVGHFPNLPIMPGVMIVEALAQVSGLLAIKTVEDEGGDTSGIYLFASIDDARFKRSVLPGDQLRFEVTLTKRKSHIWKFSCSAFVDGELACSAQLTSARRSNPAESGNT